jgi:hypothetical protein
MAKRTFFLCVTFLMLFFAPALRADDGAQNAEPSGFLVEFLEKTKPREITDGEPRLQKLLKQRFNVAVHEFQERYTGHETGESTPRELLDAALRLMDAEIELASSPAERTGILQRHLGAMKEFEMVFETLVQSGLRKSADLNHIRFERLTIEIELEKSRTRG